MFLILPTLIVAVGAFTTSDGLFTLDNVSRLFTDDVYVNAFARSIQLALATSIAGAIVGGLLAWAVVRGDPDGLLRQLVIAASGVLAQFGGVMLAFAFLATFGFNGLVTLLFKYVLQVNILPDPSWLYSLAGLVVVYMYFQIPFMRSGLPAVARGSPAGLAGAVGEASACGSSWRSGGTLAVRCCARRSSELLLLLFANALSAYATAAGADQPGQSDAYAPDRARSRASVVLARQTNVGKAVALLMMHDRSLAMSLYASSSVARRGAAK